jgi:energy-coupling factor transporter ATP-binding protein EcfA2
LIDRLRAVILAKLRSPLPIRDHILLTGVSGSGKTSIVKLLSKAMFNEREDLLIFSHLVDCGKWKVERWDNNTIINDDRTPLIFFCLLIKFILAGSGRSSESIRKELSPILNALKCRAPAILFLDNFDFLNSPVEDEEQRAKFIPVR